MSDRRGPRTRRRRVVPAVAVVCLALAGGGCGGGREKRAERDPAGREVPGHAALRFAGTVTGGFDTDVKVRCFAPNQRGDSFTISIDSDEGIPVGAVRFLSMDFSVPDYHGPRSYELTKALASEEDFPEDEFFLLFGELEKAPFSWGGPERRGTITIDAGETSGRLAIEGWTNGEGASVRVEGRFRCGTSPSPPGDGGTRPS